jgi:hypothetical protein
LHPPFSHLAGGLRVGPDFFARKHALSGPSLPGLVARAADLGNAELDVARVHPDVLAFFEQTAGLELLVRSDWRFPFSVGWWLLRPAMRAIGQFVLPLREGRVATRVLALDGARDGRPDARAVIRTYTDSGEVMQVVAYATWRRDETGYLSCAFPLPGGQILGVLRLDRAGEDAQGRLSVALTSTRRGADDAGVWLVVGGLALRSPLGERLELWAPGTPGAPPNDPAALPGATIVGKHEQRLFGVRFVTHRYWFRPIDASSPP